MQRNEENMTQPLCVVIISMSYMYFSTLQYVIRSHASSFVRSLRWSFLWLQVLMQAAEVNLISSIFTLLGTVGLTSEGEVGFARSSSDVEETSALQLTLAYKD